MKVKEILTERRVNPAEAANNLKWECKSFLEEARGEPLWRGVPKILPPISWQACPVNRAPRDTDYPSHKAADEWFLKHTGIRFRSNATFAMGNEMETESYSGTPWIYRLFPVGEFRFVYSENVSDLTFDVLDHIQGDWADEEELSNAIFEKLDNCGYTDTNLYGGIRSGHEIMIHAPKGFYLLKYNCHAGDTGHTNDYYYQVVDRLK